MGLGLLVAGIGLTIYSSYNRIVVKPNKPHIVENTTPTATPTPDPLAPYSILLMGYGGGTHEGGKLTDSIMLVRIKPHEQKITLISIPRDLWVELPVNGDNTKGYKINAAYAIGSDDRSYPNKKAEFTGRGGGGEMAKYIAGQVVGFKIDYFAALDFKGFVKIIDILGGIDVNVQKTFDDPKYPIETDSTTVDNCGHSPEEVAALTATMSGEKLEDQFPCRYEQLHFDKGVQHMNGETALKFARSRHSPTDGGDFNRAARQRQVVLAVKEKVISLGFVSKIIPTIKVLGQNLTTDIDFGKMEELVDKAEELQSYTINSLALTNKDVLIETTSPDRQSILSPRTGLNNWDEIHQYLNDPKSILTVTPTAKTTTY